MWHHLASAQLTALAPAADTDGCANIDCGTGASCADVAAPGTGYECSCNSGFTGDTAADAPATCVANTCDSFTCSGNTFNRGASTTGSDATPPCGDNDADAVATAASLGQTVADCPDFIANVAGCAEQPCDDCSMAPDLIYGLCPGTCGLCQNQNDQNDQSACCADCTITCTAGQDTSGACDGSGASDTVTCAGEFAHAHLDTPQLVAISSEG